MKERAERVSRWWMESAGRRWIPSAALAAGSLCSGWLAAAAFFSLHCIFFRSRQSLHSTFFHLLQQPTDQPTPLCSLYSLLDARLHVECDELLSPRGGVAGQRARSDAMRPEPLAAIERQRRRDAGSAGRGRPRAVAARVLAATAKRRLPIGPATLMSSLRLHVECNRALLGGPLQGRWGPLVTSDPSNPAARTRSTVRWPCAGPSARRNAAIRPIGRRRRGRRGVDRPPPQRQKRVGRVARRTCVGALLIGCALAASGRPFPDSVCE
jgi:hypothetical protein